MSLCSCDKPRDESCHAHGPVYKLLNELDVVKAELEKTKKERDQIKAAHDSNLCRWEVSEKQFVTTREAKVLKDREEALKRVAEMNAQLNQRNESTKAWIQSDTQCREYANKLRAELEELKNK